MKLSFLQLGVNFGMIKDAFALFVLESTMLF